jgi:hypothetical protein
VVADLEVLPVHRADAAVQFRVLDLPVEDLLRMRRVADVVDLAIEVGESGDVHVGAPRILLHFDIRGHPAGARMGHHVRDHVHRLAAAVLLVERPDGDAGVLRLQRHSAEGQCGRGQQNRSTHQAS